MRTDCTRDNRKTYLPNASHLGFDLWHAKRGNWIQYQEEGASGEFGRVLGRVHADGKTYIEIIAALGAFDCPAIRWIEPESVLRCVEKPPSVVFNFFAGDWSKPAELIAQVERGLPRDR